MSPWVVDSRGPGPAGLRVESVAGLIGIPVHRFDQLADAVDPPLSHALASTAGRSARNASSFSRSRAIIVSAQVRQ